MKPKHCCRHFCICLVISCFGENLIYSFDWFVYVQKYPDLAKSGITCWYDAFNHYLNCGIYEGRKTAVHPPPVSGFDWQYYVEHNNIPCNNETDALTHYNEQGRSLNLPYCKSYKLIILLHLYNLEMMDEFIAQINYFMRINPHNTYRIIINIPVDRNIEKFFYNGTLRQKVIEFYDAGTLPGDCIVHDSFHLRNNKNSKKLDCLVRYFLNSLHNESRAIQFLFSPNRGRDIGGFFLQLDQVIKQGMQHDYIVKIHSKKSPHAHALWRALNTSFLRIHINPLLRDYECVYSNKIKCNAYTDCIERSKGESVNCEYVQQLMKFFHLVPCDFSFCAGTMFIVSKKFTEFFKNYDLLKIFAMLNDEASFANALDGRIEHAFERFFGGLFEHLKLKTYCLDYQPTDNIQL